MDVNKIHEIVNEAEHKPNKDLYSVEELLSQEFEKTKDLIIELTRHLESVRHMHEIVSNEITKRTKKI
jgi:hypothetical protein